MKKTTILIIIILIVMLIAGGFIFSKTLSNKGPKATPTPTPKENIIETIPNDSLNIKLEPRYDKKAVTIITEGLLEKGFKEFEYEISYDTEDGLTQGSFSREPITITNNPFEREILLGTCSKNVCKYDKGVKNIKLTFRLKDNGGKTKIWEKEFNIE